MQTGWSEAAVDGAAAPGPERDRLWQIVNGVWPHYDTYQSRTDPQIPVVVLSPR